jgi:hypothetical protein
MEPTFSSPASMNTMTPGLATQIEVAVAALPTAHRLAPQEREIVENEEAFPRLQDWAFTRGFAFAIESAKPGRIVFRCTHHQKRTRNTRRTAEADWERVQKQTQSRGCPFALYVSEQKRLGGGWAIGSTCLEYNHPPNPDPFQYIQHRSKRPGHAQAVVAATAHCGVISYSESAEILRKEGL